MRFILPSPMKWFLVLAFTLTFNVAAFGGSAAWNVNSSSSWSTNTNWNPTTGHPNGIDQFASFTNNISAARTITLDASKVIGALNFGDSTSSYFGFTISGTGTNLTLDVTSGNATITKGPAGNTAVDTVSVPILLNDNLLVTNNVTSTGAGGRIILSGVISESGGARSITKLGTGRLELTGQSTFTGGVTLSVNDLTVNNASTTRDVNDILISGPLGTGTFTLDGGRWIQGSSSADNNIISNPVFLTAATTSSIAVTGVSTLDGVFSGPGGFTKGSAGTLTLPALNTYTGQTIIGNGEIVANRLRNAGENSSLGAPTGASATIMMGTGTGVDAVELIYNGSGDSTDRIIDLANTTATVTINQSGSGPLVFTSNLTASGLGAKTLTLAGSARGIAQMAGAIPDSGGGATSILKSGTGLWILSGANTYTGTTTVATGGALQFANTNALYGGNTSNWTAANLIVNAQAAMIFNVGGVGEFTLPDIDTLRNLGSGTDGFTPGSSIGIDTTNNGGPLTYSTNLGDITGGNGLLKIGTHNLILDGTNTYTGLTTVVSGTLTKGAASGIPAGTALILGLRGVGTPTATLDLSAFDQTASLLYALGHSTSDSSVLLGPANTLTVTGSPLAVNAVVVGNDVDFVGTSTTRLAVVGATGTLDVNAPGKNIVVSQSTSSTGSALLDLSGLGTFTANVANVYVGRPTDVNGAVQDGSANRSTGILRLANAHNTITASSAVVVGAANGTSYGTGNELRLGSSNVIAATQWVVGVGRSSALVAFDTGLTNPTVNIHGLGGPTTTTNITLADQINVLGIISGTGGSTSTTGTMDFTGGTVTALIDVLTLGTGSNNTSNQRGEANGIFIFGGAASSVTVNTLVIGTNRDDNNTNTAENPAIVSNSAMTVNGGTFILNSLLEIARDKDATDTPTGIQGVTGTFTLNGGTATIGSISTPVNTVVGSKVPGGNAGTVTATLAILGGTYTSNGDILQGPTGNGTMNSILTLDGGTLDLTGHSIAGLTTRTFASGVLQNVLEINAGAALVKSTNGTLTLAGSNAYTGPTTVSAGTLAVNGTHSGSGAYSVDSGATLRGTGQIAAAVAVNSTGTVRGGNSIGTLTIGGGLAVGPGGSIYVEIADGSTPSGTAGGSTVGTFPNPTSNNYLNITGGVVTIDASATVIVNLSTVSPAFTFGSPYSYRIGAAGPGNDLTSLSITNPAQFLFIDFANIADSPSLTGDAAGNIYFTFTPVVPEPGALFGVAVVALLGLRRRSR